MTDFRALCAELLDWLEVAPAELVDRARAALAQPEPQGPMPEVDDILRLAAIIRRVDGNHDKGAAALAEAILSHPDSRWQHAQPEPPSLKEQALDVLQRYTSGEIVLMDSGIDTIRRALEQLND
jgi:hypothetical protein